MTTLATHDLGPNLLDLLENVTAAAPSFADKFRAACEAEALANDGWVNPNAVRLRLLEEPDYDARTYSAQWGPACGRSGFLIKTDHPVQIAGKGSKGNGNKSTTWRRWAG